MARHHYYGNIISVERDNLTERQEDALVALLEVGAVNEGGRIGAWTLLNDHHIQVHGAVLNSIFDRGLAEKLGSLINDDWNNTYNWWLTEDGVEVAEEIKKRREAPTACSDQ